MYKFALFILIWMLSGFSSLAQSRLFKSGNVQKDIYLELPFEVFHGHIIVQAEIQGAIHRFLFDTGAPNMIRGEFLSTKVKPKSQKISDSQNQKGKMALGIIDSLTLCGVNFYEYAALDHDFSENFPFSCYDIAGFIGSNLFRDLIVKIDWKGQKLIVTDDLAKVNPTTTPIKMKLVGSQLLPYISLSLGTDKKRNLPVLVDIGYNHQLMLNKKEYEKKAQKAGFFSRVMELEGIGSTGIYGAANSHQYAVTANRIGIGAVDLTNMNIATSNGSSKIGTKFLAYGDMILDYKHKHFYFESTDKIVDLTTELPAYTPGVRDQKMVIGFIYRDDLKSMMKPGDQIISVDGVDLSKLEPCRMLEVSPRAKERLQILSDGKLVDITL